MKLNKYFSTLLGGLMLFGTWACTDKIEPEPTPAYEGDDVYFSTSASTDVDIPINATQVAVNIYRVKADGTLTVNLSSSFATENEEGNIVPVDGIFSAPASVTFEQGAKSASIPVSVDFSQIVAGQEYYMTVKIEGDLTSVYGDSEKTFTMVYSQWSEWTWYETPATLIQWALNGAVSESGEAGTLSPADLEDSMDPDGNYYLLYYDGQIVTRKSLINENLWMIGVGGPRYSNFNFNFIFTIDESKKVKVGNEEFPIVSLENAETHFENQGKNYSITDCRTFMQIIGQTPGTEVYEGNWENLGMADSYYDPNTGVIHLFPVMYDGLSLLPIEESFFYLPGFADYSMEYNYTGNFVNNSGVESAVITITRSDDVHSYVYTVEFGALSDEQVAEVGKELEADTDLELNYEVSQEIMVPCSEDGIYTIVAVMYDQKGVSVGYSSYQFNFASVMKESKWAKAGLAYFTDDIMTSFFENYPGDTYEVECEQSKENPGLFRLVNPLADWLQNQNFGNPGTPGYIYFDVTDPDAVYIIDSPLGLTCKAVFKTNEEIYLIDQGFGMDSEEMIECGANGVMEDGVITFPSTFVYNSKEYSLMLLSVESLWKDGKALPTNEQGYLEIVMPDSFSAEAQAIKAKAKGMRTPKPTTIKKVTCAQRGFLSVAKRKAQKAEKKAAALKEYKDSRLNKPMTVR